MEYLAMMSIFRSVCSRVFAVVSPLALSRPWGRGWIALLFAGLVAMSGGVWNTGFAQTAQFSNARSTVASGTANPYGVAVDGSGNVFVVDQADGWVSKEAASGTGYTGNVIVSGLNSPEGIAIDTNGELFISGAGSSQVVKETLSGGSYTQSVVAGGLYNPVGVAVDSNGNVYIADSGNNRILMETLSAGGYVQSVIISNSSYAEGIAVDGSGNLYIADENNNQVLKETPSSGSYVQSSVATGLNTPLGVAIDGSGDVFIADYDNNRVVEEILTAGNYTQGQVVPLDFPSALAIDGSGNLYVVTQSVAQVLKLQFSVGNFGSVSVGAPSAKISLTFTFDGGGSIAAPVVVTQGIAGLDFADAGTGSCDTNGTSFVYGANATCTVDVIFTPKFAGTRYGAAVLMSSTGSVIATGYVQGTGVGPQVSFPPGTQSSVLTAAATSFYGIAMDGSGNLYVADYGNGRILKETLSAGSYYQSILVSGLSNPNGIAVDGAGNVYIADTFSGLVLKETPAGDTYTESTVAGVFAPEALALDGSGNLYIVTSSGSSLLKETLSNGSYSESTVVNGLYLAEAVAVDGTGNIYIASVNPNDGPGVNSGWVLKETLSNGSYTQSVVASGFILDVGVAVDGSGNVYVADFEGGGGPNYLGLVYKETLSGSTYTQSTIGNDINRPWAIAADGTGNVYITSNYASAQVVKMDFADTPSLSFATTAYNSTSTDSPQTVTVENSGNAELSFPIPASGNNPSISPSFTLDSGGASDCPLVASGSSAAGTLAPGASCQLPISFQPVAVGNLSGSLVITDNNLNAASPAYATQSISLSGTAAQATPTITWAQPAAITYGTNLGGILNASAASIGQSVPGAFAYTATITGGTAAVVTAASVPGAGSYTLNLVFTPTDSTNYTTATATVNLIVNQATPTITWATPTAISYGTALSATQLNASSTVAGAFAFSPAAGTVLGIGAQTLGVTFTPTNTTDYTTATSSVTLTVNKATSTITWATPSAISYGTALSATQLDASSTVAGAFVYSPVAGTVPGAGPQTLSVTFTPTDATDYTTATSSVTLTVNQATPTITWATPTAISYGTALSVTQLDASSTVAGTFVYSPAAGTVLGVGAQTLGVTFTPTNTTDYTTATSSVTLTVNKATPAVMVVSSANPAFVSSPVTFTANVTSPSGTPTGTVTFFDGTTQLGSRMLNAGVVTYTTSALLGGSHSITAVYSGDSNFVYLTGAALTEMIEDFTLGSSGSGSSTSQTASPGGQAVYTLAIAPPGGLTFGEAITFAVTGLPPGATAVFSPSTIAAGAGATDVTLTVSLPNQSALRLERNPFGGRQIPIALGLILVPFAGRVRRASRRLNRIVCLWMLALACMALATGLTGCGGKSAQSPESYTLTITATSGSLSHSTTVELTVE